jgi:hypothetical protein
MTVTISAEDPRSIKAIEICAGASQWLKVRSTDGELAFGVPTQCQAKTGRYYLVTAHTCDCEDFKRNGLSRPRFGEEGYHGLCKHIRAVRLYMELVKASQAQPKRRRHLAVVPPPSVVANAAKYDEIFGKL